MGLMRFSGLAAKVTANFLEQFGENVFNVLLEVEHLRPVPATLTLYENSFNRSNKRYHKLFRERAAKAAPKAAAHLLMDQQTH